MLPSASVAMSSSSSMLPLSAWTAARAAEAMGGEIPARFAEARFAPVSTDSRSVGPGEWFLALRGETHDGHRYCPTAVEKGAAGLIVARDFPDDFDARLPVLRVADTLAAYGALATRQRLDWGGIAVAVSGSVGKTTTRRILARALSSRMKTLEPIRNYNNLIGVPQTLLRLEPDHEIAALELGMNQRGELAALARIARPDVAGLTRIGRTHIGMFRSHAELIEEKLSLLFHLPPGASAIVNAACPNTRPALDRLRAEYRVVAFSADDAFPADYRATNVRRLGDRVGFRFDLETPSGRVADISIPRFGRHLIEDAAAAAALLGAAGRDPAWVRDPVENFESEPLRGEIVEGGKWTFILDCYNAAPESTTASLRSLAELADEARRPRLAIVLADMLELGDHSAPLHDALLESLRPLAPARFFGLGPQCSRLAGILASEGWNARGFALRDDLLAAVRDEVPAGDWIYFKGSHGFALETVAEALASGSASSDSAGH